MPQFHLMRLLVLGAFRDFSELQVFRSSLLQFHTGFDGQCRKLRKHQKSVRRNAQLDFLVASISPEVLSDGSSTAPSSAAL